MLLHICLSTGNCRADTLLTGAFLTLQALSHNQERHNACFEKRYLLEIPVQEKQVVSVRACVGDCLTEASSVTCWW